MVKERAKEKLEWPFGKRIGQIRISSEELAQLIESSVEDERVSATSKRHKFSSLEDIRRYLPLFAGNVEVKLGSQEGYDPNEVRMSLGTCTVVNSHSSSKDTEIHIEKICSELKHYRIPLLGYLAMIPQFCWFVTVLVLFWLLPASGQPVPQYISGLSSKVNAALLFGLLGVSMTALIVSALPSVYYNPRQTFWQRNRDTIIVGVLMLIVGAVIGEIPDFFSKVGEK